MVILSLSGLIAGACFGWFARALALIVAMTAFAIVMTLIVAIPNGWSVADSALGFVAVAVAFQCAYIAVAGLRFVLNPPGEAGTRPVPVVHPRRRRSL